MFRVLKIFRIPAKSEVEWIIKSLRGQIVFTRIRQTDFLLWDAVGSEYFQGLNDLGATDVLHVRGEVFNLNPRTIRKFIQHILQGMSRSEAYFASCVAQFKPSVVLTHIDNDRRFHNLSQRFPNIEFIAIQNGMRWPNFPDTPPALQPKKYNSTMICFSDFDLESWQSYGASFKELQVSGSLRNSFYSRVKRLPNLDSDVTYADICIISEYSSPRGNSELLIVGEFRQLLSSLGTFLKSRPSISAVVALVSERDDLCLSKEKEFFSQYLPSTVTFRPRSVHDMSNYALTDSAKVTVSSFSTLGFETVARGNRTLMAGPTVYRLVLNSGFPNEIWVSGLEPQSRFDEALDTLLMMDDDTFKLRTLQSVNYFTGSNLGDSAMDILQGLARRSLATQVNR